MKKKIPVNAPLADRLEHLEKFIERRLVQEKEILNLGEACAYLSTSKSQMYKLTSQNIIPHSKPGGKLVYFKKVDLDAWAMSNPISTQAELDMKASQHILKNNPINLN